MRSPARALRGAVCAADGVSRSRLGYISFTTRIYVVDDSDIPPCPSPSPLPCCLGYAALCVVMRPMTRTARMPAGPPRPPACPLTSRALAGPLRIRVEPEQHRHARPLPPRLGWGTAAGTFHVAAVVTRTYRLKLLIRFDHFLAAVTRFDHCAADSEAQPHSAGFTRLLGLGRGKYNNIPQQL